MAEIMCIATPRNQRFVRQSEIAHLLVAPCQSFSLQQWSSRPPVPTRESLCVSARSFSLTVMTSTQCIEFGQGQEMLQYVVFTHSDNHVQNAITSVSSTKRSLRSACCLPTSMVFLNKDTFFF